MEPLHQALLALQELDQELQRAERGLSEFEPQLAEIETPLNNLEKEVESTRSRLADLRTQATRLERAAEVKRERLHATEARLDKVRNQREEQAIHLEIDLVRKAADADDAEALQVMDQVTRTDLRLEELEKQLVKMREEATPRRADVLQAKQDAETAFAVLRDRRENEAGHLDVQSRRLYDRVRKGKANVALAPLTEEGACGHCFNVLPLQEQSLVKRGTTLHRCEACGVILYVA
jgi:predicted  nucleic acid-binding Zn-ribbon protein